MNKNWIFECIESLYEKWKDGIKLVYWMSYENWIFVWMHHINGKNEIND